MKHYRTSLRLVPIALFIACSTRSNEPDNAVPGAPGTEPPATSLSPTDPTNRTDTPDAMKRNPIENIQPAKLVLDTGAFTDGPIWSVAEGVLFFTTPLGEGGLYRMKPDGATMKVRDGSRVTSELPIGNTIDKSGTLFTVEAKRIVRASAAADAGAPLPVAMGYDDADAGLATFDTLNDAVIAANGTIYATDPGYFAAPIANRIFRITPAGKVLVAEAFDEVPRPNGIALSPDGKALFVGFSEPIQGTKPFVRKYEVNPDGSLGTHTKFVELGLDQAPDGIEVDQAGNLFVATKAGITVFKNDGSPLGVVAIPEVPTAMAFGGRDLKTLYVTTQGTKIFELTVNVSGIVQ